MFGLACCCATAVAGSIAANANVRRHRVILGCRRIVLIPGYAVPVVCAFPASPRDRTHARSGRGRLRGAESLGSHCPLRFEPLELAPLFACQLVGAERDLDLPQRTGELERHLRVVLVDDRRSGVRADVEALVERVLADWRGLLDAALGHRLAIDQERSETSFAKSPAVVREVEND